MPEINPIIRVAKTAKAAESIALEAKQVADTALARAPVPGPQGAKGDKGEKGDKGDPGRDGRDGRNGVDGKDGINGKDGTNGKDGQGFKWQGAFRPGVKYDAYDVVRFEGSSWVFPRPGRGATPAAAGAEIMVERGEEGKGGSVFVGAGSSSNGGGGGVGPQGPAGADGKSAYEVAVQNGFVGSEAAWLASLVGPPGAHGPQGTAGTNGTNGADGADGADGLSAYQIAVANGFVGTEAEWLDSLQASGGGTTGTVVVDFGAFSYTAKTSIADPTVTASTHVIVSVGAPAAGRDADELEFSPISPAAVVIDGVGIDIYAMAPIGADGAFNINYTRT